MRIIEGGPVFADRFTSSRDLNISKVNYPLDSLTKTVRNKILALIVSTMYASSFIAATPSNVNSNTPSLPSSEKNHQCLLQASK